MTSVVQIVMLGIAIVLLCMQIQELAALWKLTRRPGEAETKRPRRKQGHIDLEETKLPKK